MKLCKECKFFCITEKPMMPFERGKASCSKYGLFIEFLNMRKINRLKCVEESEGDVK